MRPKNWVGERVELCGLRGVIVEVYPEPQGSRAEPSALVQWDNGDIGQPALDGRLKREGWATMDDGVASGW